MNTKWYIDLMTSYYSPVALSRCISQQDTAPSRWAQLMCKFMKEQHIDLLDLRAEPRRNTTGFGELGVLDRVTGCTSFDALKSRFALRVRLCRCSNGSPCICSFDLNYSIEKT